MEKLERKLPVRVSIVAINVLAFAAVLWAIIQVHEASGDLVELYMFLSGVCGAAIGGDTIRPSGRIKANGK